MPKFFICNAFSNREAGCPYGWKHHIPRFSVDFREVVG